MDEQRVLSSVFFKLFGRPINGELFPDRLILQKVVYLLNAIGASCGDFGFVWYVYGPYSAYLNTLSHTIDSTIAITTSFDNRTEKALKILIDIINKTDARYDMCNWLEALGSLHFLSTYMYPNLSKSEILEIFSRCKPQLAVKELNILACDLVFSLPEVA